jgi:2-polyprenyl-3-methyl-5-hydroxy-6-metoxy-1,4-benzoquinol methylase
VRPTSCNLCHANIDVAPHVARRKDGFEIICCPFCRLLFRASMPSAAELTEIYDAGYFHDDPAQPDREGYADYRADAPVHRRNARKRLRMLSAAQLSRGRLLDVGCAAGFFVAEARRLNWAAEGVDVSEELIGWGTRHVSPNLVAGTFAERDVARESVNVVTMWDYIEHSIDPRADLDRAWEILVPGGLIALSTGDVGSLFARVSGKRWHLLTPRHHNFFFSQSTLTRMLRSAGFEPVSSTHCAAWYSAKHLAYKLESLLARGIGRAASHHLGTARLGQVQIPVNLFDIVTVIARKPATV